MTEPTIERLARATYDGWCGGECAASWEKTGDWTKGSHRRAAAAAVLALDELGLIAGTADGDRLVAAAMRRLVAALARRDGSDGGQTDG